MDDPIRFHEVIWRDPQVMKFIKVKHMRQGFGRHQEYKGQTVINRLDEFPKNMPNVWGIKHCNGWDPATFLTHPEATWGVKNKDQDPEERQRHQSVMLVMIRLLHWLGIRRVYLVGANFKMSAGPQKYNFDEKVPDGKVRGNNALFSWLDHRFQELAPVFRAAGYKVYNCTPGSKLQAFKQLDLQLAIQRELTLGQIPETVRTQGFYT